LRASKVHGIGVFAIREIPEGESVFYGSPKQKWVCFKKDELGRLPEEIKLMIDDFLPTDKQGGVSVPENGLNGMDISFFLNHSKKPNCRAVRNGSFITIRKIAKGEELTVNYTCFDPYFRQAKKFQNISS